MTSFSRNHRHAFGLRAFLTAALLAACNIAAARSGEPAPAAPQGLTVFHRDGQTFLTWNGINRSDSDYLIYRSDKSFNGRKPEPAELVGIVRATSVELLCERPADGLGHGLMRAAVTDRDRGGMPLEAGTGLFVWTAKAEGRFHYCVNARILGRETEVLPAAGTNATAEPVNERPGAPGAVQLASTGVAGWYYLQFGDFTEWSRDKVDSLWGGPMWSFHVAIPEDVKKGEKLPVRFHLHGVEGQGAHFASSPIAGVRQIYVSPQDWQDGMWWGWATSILSSGPGPAWTPRKTDLVEPYAARRLARVIEWVAGAPGNLGAEADTSRMYLYGHSSGGSGALVFVLSGQKGAERIAGVVATKFPITWPAGLAWEKKLERVWGPRELKLVAAGFDAPAYEALTPLFMAKRLAAKPLAFEPPLIELSLGTADEFSPITELPALAAALEKAKIPYFAHWGKYGHDNGRLSGAKNKAFGARLDEPVLAFANASCNGKAGKGGDAVGYLNAAIEWWSSANSFAPEKPELSGVVEVPERCEFRVRLVTGTPAEYKPDDAKAVATVDVTPRRLGKFRPAPGTRCAWTTTDLSDPEHPRKLGGGEAVADAQGLVTVPKVQVGKAGWGTGLTIEVVEKK